VTSLSAAAHAERTLQEYRYFRALSIDLVRRMPTREEIAAFESPDWTEDAWIDAHLTGPGYSERLRSIYQDALRLEVGTTFTYVQNPNILRRYPVKVRYADGTDHVLYVYFRQGQRRASATYDRGFCFNTADTGQTYVNNRAPEPADAPIAVPIATFNQRVTSVKPWWLYRDYVSPSPSQHYSSWRTAEPRYLPGLASDKATDPTLLVDAEGQPVTSVYVCNEEAQTTASVTVNVRGTPTTVDCGTQTGFTSASCGCGVGLERCNPAAGFGNDPTSFVLPTEEPLGASMPFAQARQRQSQWWRQAWLEEAQAMFDKVFVEDRDFREVLTGRWTMVNGPLAQFYRGVSYGNCCNDFPALGAANYAVPQPLFLPSNVPAGIAPTEMDRWVEVKDRGPRASGILTMPIFMAKYGSRRAKAHVLYRAFLCRDFVAENLELQPSTEPNLMVRPGCATCHQKLEPLAAYFSRVKESTFSWIPAPIDNPACAKQAATGDLPAGACKSYYDVDFSTTAAGKLRGAYASPSNAEAGPAGMAAWTVSQPEFSSCIAQTVAQSFLGRPLDAEDAALEKELEQKLVENGFRMRAMVRALLKADAYRKANNLSSDAWREGGGK
jgi:hypothetical protein